MTSKTCKGCGETKALDHFYRSPGMKDGHRNDCKTCNLAEKKRRYDADPNGAIARTQQWQQENAERHRAYQAEYRQRPERKRKMRDLYYRRTFGISADDVDAMIEAQGGVCAICGQAPEREASWHVDHDHETGEVRGMLCIDCNHGIGKLGDSVERLQAAIDYLVEWRQSRAS